MAKLHSNLSGTDLHNPKGISVETHSTSSLIISQSAESHTGVISSSAHFVPSSTNTYDLGSATQAWRKLYVITSSIEFVNPSGTTIQTMTADADGISFGSGQISGSAISGSGLYIGGSANITGNLTLGGNITIGDADTDSIIISAELSSSLIPDGDNVYDLGSSSKQWKDLYVNGIGYIDQLGTDADPITIYANGGEVDGIIIGGESAAAGTFTTLDCTDGAFAIANLASSTISGVSLGGTLAALTAGDGLNNGGGTFTGATARTFSVDSGSMVAYYSSSAFSSVSGDIEISAGGAATIQANSVALSTDTTGNYVGTLTGGTGITSTGATSGEGIAHSISVDASQSQITTVGTVTGGVWNSTFGADANTLISGSFTAASSSFSSRVTTLEAQDVDDDLTIAGDSGGNLTIDFDSETLTIAGGEGIDTAGSTNTITISGEDSTAANKGIVIVAGGTNATVGYSSGTATVNVDDSFLVNDADDTTSGTITAAGFTTSGHISSSASITGSDIYASGTIYGTLGTASQTAITSVGTIGTGTWEATDVAVLHGGTGASSAGDARTNLGVAIGSDVQAYDAQLADVAGLAVTNGNFIVGDGTNFVAESGNTARTSLSLGTGDSPTFTAVTTTGGITVGGNLTVNGTTTTVSSSVLDIGDRIITLNANSAAGDGGLYVNDADTAETGSLLWDVSADRWIGGLSGSEVTIPTISSTDELTNKTLTTPTIASFTNATHDHADATGGGTITLGTGTTGNYVATAVAGGGIDVSGATGNVTISVEDSTASNKGAVIVEGGTGISVGYSSGTATVTGHTKYALTEDLASGEITQLQAIGSTTISATQWGYLGAASGPITNTNQLTTFTLRGTTNTNPTTVNHGDTITIAAGTGITTTSTSDGVITITGHTKYTDSEAVSAVSSADDYLKNDADDTTSGTITAGGFTTTGTLDISGGTLTTSAAQKEAIMEGAGANIDIGAYSLTAQTLVSDVTTGTAPLTVASTTVVTNLNADLLDGQEGSYYTDFTNQTVANGEITDAMLNDDVATGLAGAGTTATSGVVNVIGGDGITANANDVAVTAAQTTITSMYNTSLKIGRDSGGDWVDFGTDDNIKVYLSNWEEFRFATGGTFHADADVVAYSSTVASDQKLKTNIQDIKYGLDDVLKLQGREFDWKKEGRGHDVGFIAQEIQEVIPELVKEVDGLNGDDSYLTVNYAALVPVLVESIKQLKSEIDELKS